MMPLPNLARFGVCLALGLALGLGLAACETPSPVQTFPEITFGHLAPIRLDVARISVENAYRPPLNAPHVEHLVPVSPSASASRWVADRLVAAGAQGSALVRIEDARIVETRLPTESGLRGLVKTEQAERYDLRLAAGIEVRGADNRVKARADVEVTRTRTVPEGLSPRARDQAWFEMVEQAMRTFDFEMERQIRANLAGSLL